MEDRSEIGEWFRGKSVIITGVTGFMGKVLMEKLLRSTEVDKIYLLMRPKREKLPAERLQNIFALAAFDRVREIPHIFDKVEIINADIAAEGLGISSDDRQKLINNASMVFHYAAQLRLEAQLRDAVEMNVAGTQRLLDLCKEMKNFVCFIHLSTTFCSVDLDIFEERVYDAPADPQDIIRLVRGMNRDSLAKIKKELMKPQPNAYTYTKRLAEAVVANAGKTLKVAIIRPSIVGPAALEPLPGWVDTINGPIGIVIASGKGVLRSMHCNGNSGSHVVPVDIATNTVIVVAWKLGIEAELAKEVPVYNLTNDETVKATWYEVLDTGRNIVYNIPFEMLMWYPNGTISNNYYLHFTWSLFVHWLPAIVIDSMLFLFRQKTFMIRVQKRIYHGLELLQYFSSRNWVFRSQNFLNLSNLLKGTDKESFSMDFHRCSMAQYMAICILGARVHCLKEDQKSLPKWKIIIKILYMLDKISKTLIIYGAYRLAWTYSDGVKYLSNVFKENAKIVPYLLKAYMNFISV